MIVKCERSKYIEHIMIPNLVFFFIFKLFFEHFIYSNCIRQIIPKKNIIYNNESIFV